MRRNEEGKVTVDDEEYFENLLKLVGVSELGKFESACNPTKCF